MPLRKQGTILKSTLVLGAAAALVAPSTASAGLLDSLFKPRTTTTTTTSNGNIVTTTNAPAPATTPAPAPTTPAATTPAPSTTGDITTSANVPAPTSCTPLPTSKAFQKVDGDTADYSPAPNGTFENGATGWTLTGGAKVATANETLGIAPGRKALQMPLLSTATSPSFCVDESHPHFRFAFKVDNAALSGFIAYVIYRDSAGKVTNIELVSSKILSLSPSMWQATPKSPLATLIPLNPGTKTATVQLKLTALSPTDLVDDLTGGALKPITNLAGTAGGLVGSITGLFGNQLNIGVTVDSVMVDPYRRG